MADPAPQGNPTPAPADPGTPPAAPSDNGGQENKPFDINTLPKEAIDAVYEQAYKSKRFTQLTDKAKQVDALLKEKADAEEAALKQNGEWEKIANNTKAELDAVKTSAIASEIKAFAAKYGAHDLNDIAALADKAAVEFKDGIVTGAEDAVKALVEAKPHLFNSNNPKTRVGNGTNPGDANNQGVPKFTHSQIKDPAFWAAHESEIMQALKNGTVVDDTN